MYLKCNGKRKKKTIILKFFDITLINSIHKNYEWSMHATRIVDKCYLFVSENVEYRIKKKKL